MHAEVPGWLIVGTAFEDQADANRTGEPRVARRLILARGGGAGPRRRPGPRSPRRWHPGTSRSDCLTPRTTALIQSRLFQHDPEVDAVSFGAIDEGDL
jgi:hypothetical protein